MRILISGICGFSGSTVARTLLTSGRGHQIAGFDNSIRPGSETNRELLLKLGVDVMRTDLRFPGDIDALPDTDFVIAAADKNRPHREQAVFPLKSRGAGPVFEVARPWLRRSTVNFSQRSVFVTRNCRTRRNRGPD